MLLRGNASDETESWMVKHISLRIGPKTVASLKQRKLQERQVLQN